MSNLDFTISCIVTFFSKKMVNSPNLTNGKYSPQIVVKGTEEHLEINFIDGEDVTFDKPIQANAAEFLIMDNGNVVGEGVVKEIFQHKPYGSK